VEEDRVSNFAARYKLTTKESKTGKHCTQKFVKINSPLRC